MSADGALGGVESGGDVAEGSAAVGEQGDNGVPFDWSQLAIGDAVPGEGALERDVVDVGSVGAGTVVDGARSVSMSSHADGGGQPWVAASRLTAFAEAVTCLRGRVHPARRGYDPLA